MATSTLRARIEEVLRDSGVVHPDTGGITHWNSGPTVVTWREDKHPSELTGALVSACADWMRDALERLMGEVEGDGA